MQSELDKLKDCLQSYEKKNKAIQAFVQFLKIAKEGDQSAQFISNQAANFNNQKPSYCEALLREYVLQKTCSQKGV
ncbi:hypothetical protein HPB48_014649 [Haemaphysalis longicornis]|uniref:Uncharacterized protein n=1 Tax=Haemaphysalis longicornis TaxID=44386 RepID=A0A9J6GJP8_HAELO|nr:hypothetical protein HPB48_014649 [Haemaphysalis longicornis]